MRRTSWPSPTGLLNSHGTGQVQTYCLDTKLVKALKTTSHGVREPGVRPGSRFAYVAIYLPILMHVHACFPFAERMFRALGVLPIAMKDKRGLTE